jgi:hypothetical protein
MAPSIRCSGAKSAHLAPAAGWFQEERQQMFSITCADFGDIDTKASRAFKVSETVDGAAQKAILSNPSLIHC